MNELERHIEILLLNNDCVIVPDLGGFMAHYVEAHYDDRDHTFLPPMRTLGFNPALKMNDSLLAQSYIEAYDISYPEAIQRIEDEVNELRQHMEADGFYELNNLGVLRVNEYGHYEFEPCEAGILTPQLYGLSNVEFNFLEHTETITTGVKVRPVKAETVTKDAEMPKAREIPMQHPMYTEDANDDKVHIRVSVLRNLMAAAIAIIAFFFISTPLNNGTHETSLMNVNTDMLMRVMPKTTVEGANEVKKLKVVEETQAPEDTKATEEVKVAEEAKAADESKTTEEAKAPVAKTDSKKEIARHAEETLQTYYTLVLASQVSKKNAAAYVERLQKAGFKEAQVYTKNNSTKVIFNQYKHQADAYNALNELHEYTEFQEAWVYQVK